MNGSTEPPHPAHSVNVRHHRLSLPHGEGQLAYRTAGDGPPVVLLHPVGLDGTWWSGHEAELARRHLVITVDLRGHGESAPIRRPITLDDLADDVAAVLQATTDRPAHVIGASMGGMVAQHLALRAPTTVASLVLCATAGGFAGELRPALRERGLAALRHGMAAVVEETLERWFSPTGSQGEIGRRCRDRLSTNDPVSWAASWAAISSLDTLPRLAGVPVPALVITGSRDTGTPPSAAGALAGALPGARLDIVPGAYHLGVFEHEAPFLEAFSRFLTGATSRTGVGRHA